jgi:8-oxo-dGTP diphosphatase
MGDCAPILDEMDADVIPVLAAVVQRAGRYLVCQRPLAKRHGGLWEFPGGKREEGEDYLATARRELREELGVHVTAVDGPLFSAQDPGSPFLIEFIPTLIDGHPACLEHSALQWADKAELPLLELAPSDRQFVEFLRNG